MRFRDANEAVDRLYERLVHALQQSRQDAFAAPVTVAEIYQELVPYRSMREQVGFSMNADYEHALLRLLAGDGDWVQLEPASARDIILRELNSSNPNVSIYREYAGCDVWVKAPPPGAMPVAPGTSAGSDDDALDWLASLEEDEEAAPDNAPSAGAPAPPLSSPQSAGGAFSFAELVDLEDELDDAAPGRQSAGAPEPAPADGEVAPSKAPLPDPVTAPRPLPGADGGGHGPAASGRPAVRAGGNGPTVQVASCVFCDSSLPTGRKVRFCPFCGGDQQMRPCGSCGEVLEGGWSFCVACGAPASAD
ncbi:MAG TPA: hypothetical protein VK929_10545 [Longimicrobiales bacterium]|nr:hypothetical protein [Longimicrobiales bacterium]